MFIYKERPALRKKKKKSRRTKAYDDAFIFNFKKCKKKN